jgi:hypothetical protein
MNMNESDLSPRANQRFHTFSHFAAFHMTVDEDSTTTTTNMPQSFMAMLDEADPTLIGHDPLLIEEQNLLNGHFDDLSLEQQQPLQGATYSLSLFESGDASLFMKDDDFISDQGEEQQLNINDIDIDDDIHGSSHHLHLQYHHPHIPYHENDGSESEYENNSDSNESDASPNESDEDTDQLDQGVCDWIQQGLRNSEILVSQETSKMFAATQPAEDEEAARDQQELDQALGWSRRSKRSVQFTLSSFLFQLFLVSLIISVYNLSCTQVSCFLPL